MTLRLLTYNILKGGTGGRAPAIAGIINDCAPDLVLLQEATRPAIVEQLAAATGMREWRAFERQSLAFLSRLPIAAASWHRPRFSRHAFIEVVPADIDVRVFGVHLSAVHAAWTERRRAMELRSLLRSVAQHQGGFHVLAGDFNTLAPGELLDVRALPRRLRTLVWLSGGHIKWRTIQMVLDAGYADVYRLHHPDEVAYTFPTWSPHVRLDYMFVPAALGNRALSCEIVQHPDARRASDHFPVLAELDC